MTIEKDPVCGMDVDTETSQLSFEYEGRTYWFCGKGCLLEFKDDPQQVPRPGVPAAGHVAAPGEGPGSSTLPEPISGR